MSTISFDCRLNSDINHTYHIVNTQRQNAWCCNVYRGFIAFY